MTLRTIGNLAARYLAEVGARYLLTPDPEMPPRDPEADPRMVASLRWVERMHAKGFRVGEAQP